jgi:isoamylase
MGATLAKTGVNFAVFSAHATGLELCLFSQDGETELARLPFVDRTGDVWHLHVAGLGEGQLYGLRATGPYAPLQGHRFNPHKLLIDPYARGLFGRVHWQDAVMGYCVSAKDQDLSFDTRCSAALVPKSVVVSGAFDWGDDTAPQTAMADTVIYEAHVGALTRLHPDVPPALRGTYAGLGHPAMIAHLGALGITAVELLPIHARLDDRFLVTKGLSNHWGYNTIGFFAPEPRFGSLHDLKTTVKALHAAGIEVILDVVYNHTGESDALGPTLCFRGLDNASYYRLVGGRHYVNDAGTGNTLDMTHPAVLRLVMDSLRYWVEEVHVDGFRFDLAPILGREAHGFAPNGSFMAALRQDPVLSHVKLIAEPWDLGPAGYQLGAFAAPFSEWNDQYRDGVRRFWRGDAGMAAAVAAGLLGSAARFDHDRRPPQASVNFVTAHDGFTLQDLVSFNEKRNLANGEGNRDGHGQNHSDNLGHEGASCDPQIIAARALRKRNLLATLMLSQGVPMVLSGDEIGHSQGGNNNAYAQDNETTWINWAAGDGEFAAFVGQLVALRRSHPVLRQPRFLHGVVRRDGLADVIWRKACGAVPVAGDWHDPQFACFGLELRMAAETESEGASEALFMIFNAGPAQRFTLPDTAPTWTCLLHSHFPGAPPLQSGPMLDLPAAAVVLFKATPSKE